MPTVWYMAELVASEVAGCRRGFDGVHSVLFREAWRVSCLVQARWVVLENVANICSLVPWESIPTLVPGTGIVAAKKAVPAHPGSHLEPIRSQHARGLDGDHGMLRDRRLFSPGLCLSTSDDVTEVAIRGAFRLC